MKKLSEVFNEMEAAERLRELEGKCHALWLYNKNETEEWNGDGCDCEYIQGNLVCKMNILEEKIALNPHVDK